MGEGEQFIASAIPAFLAETRRSLLVENVAMLYMGIPISLNIEIVLNPGGVDTENFCKKMMCILERALKKVDYNFLPRYVSG